MVKVSTRDDRDAIDNLPITAVAPSLPADEKKLRKKSRGAGKGKQIAAGQLTQYETYEIIEVHRSEIKNAPYNPRKITAAARKKLMAKILKVGLVAPITWNKRSGNIVGGHQRIAALDTAMHTKDYRLRVAAVDMDEKTERETNVFLNNEEAQGEWDDDKLLALFKEDKISVEEAGWDLGQYYEMFGDEGMTERPDDLEELADRIKSMSEVTKKIKESTFDINNSGFYSVVVFKSVEERIMFTSACELPEDQFIDGRKLWETLRSVGIRSDDDYSEEELDRQIVENVSICDRCGCSHSSIVFRPLFKPIGDFNYHAICLETGEPILIYISSEEVLRIQEEAKAAEEAEADDG